MRFRYKVIMINIAFLSVALGILSFLMIHRNFTQASEIQISYAIEENNLIHSSIEYQILDVINQKNPDIPESLKSAGQETCSQILSKDTVLFIIYGGELIYSSDELTVDIEVLPEPLLSSLKLGEKKHLTKREKQDYYIYIASKNIIDDTDLYIITKRNANDTYHLLYSQIRYFLLLILIVLAVCSVFMYFISTHLTKPMEQLNSISDYFAQGDYQVRADINSDDEIGLLAEKFNQMATAVSEHIEELNQMVKQHEQFVADFTHEIKTPMTTIIGYADTLRTRKMNGERQRLAYEYIYSEGKRLENMSMKLFDLIYLKDHDLEKSELSAAGLVQEISESMQPILDHRDIRLETQTEDAVIYGDRELLKTVFINLIDNARKASDENTVIFLRSYFAHDGYIMEVEDSGCGMTEETIRHICDEFY
ncbi:MAG: HAMP domain-containing histidine kinase, partial [Lachnospiraceae bacterium]|nr:HAMP domain-containing histidine kinase [Lachnospiraceae bacterium]